MNMASLPVETGLCGIRIHDATGPGRDAALQCFHDRLHELGLAPYVRASQWRDEQGWCAGFGLSDDAPSALISPMELDTTGLCQTLGLNTQNSPEDLECEILLAMLASPIPFDFPSYDELASAVNIRKNIVQNARRTALAFDTEHAERPDEFWDYDLARGFTIKPGKNLIEALQKTTQPDRSGKLYSFSCYRATEYVILLSIAQELADCNPPMLALLQQQWESRAIMSGQFHDVFLREYGAMDAPLPPRYYIPGDRLWFRNPDEPSSNVEGYEGSWVLYLGSGLFTNFWKRDQPFTLRSKCVELFHWRHGVYRNSAGKWLMDENVVDQQVAQSMRDTAEVDRIVGLMLRWRDPGGVYQDGGCIDTTRECARQVRPATGELSFPDGC